MKSKILLVQREGATVSFLFPLKDFCVGILNEYSLEEIPEKSIVYLNRLLDDEAIVSFERLLPQIEKRASAIVFEDLGILEVLQEHHSSLKTILMASHAVVSSFTANAYLEYVDALILSPDITKDETIEIASKVSKPLGIFGYGHLPYMYSRRTLLTNYEEQFQLERENTLMITEPIHDVSFLGVENKYGTVFYDEHAYDARVLLDETSIDFYFLNLEFTDDDPNHFVSDFFEGKSLEKTTTAFLNKATIYRLPPKE